MSDYYRHIFNPVLLFGAIGTIAVFSLIFRENKLYRLFEHIFIGLAMGYSLAITWTQVLRPKWWDPMTHDGIWIWALVIPIGLMFYGIYTKKYSWMARMIFGFYFGMSAGTVFQGFASEYIPQVTSSFKPLIWAGPATRAAERGVINNWIFLVILISVLTYFFFAFEQKNIAVKKTAGFGRAMLMVAMGGMFGATIMTREALLIDRVRFLLIDWLQIGVHHIH